MLRAKCDECKGKLVNKKVEFKLYGVSLGKFDAEVCTKCGETCFDEKESKEIEKSAKQKGLFGLESRTRIGKVGDALDIRLSKKLVEFLGVKKGKEVIIYPESKERLVVEVPKSEAKIADK